MVTRPSLILPPTAPVAEPTKDFPVAVYTLVDLDDTELSELRRICESECIDATPGDHVRLAPRPRFVGSPLRAVYDTHLELRRQRTFDPTYFIVAVDTDWRRRGVLLVTLDDEVVDGRGCKPDAFFIRPEDSGLIFVNLQVGNSDWEEEKRCYEVPSSIRHED